MNSIALLVAILLFTSQTVCFKMFNRTYMKNLASYFLFNFSYFSLAVLVFLIIGGIPRYFEPYTLLLGISFGVTFVFAIFSYMKAMETGPLSYSSLFFAFGLLIPIVFGTFFWNEKISIAQVFSLALLLVTFYLCAGASGNTKSGLKLRWALFCFFAFLGNGALMTLAKEHQILLPGKQVGEFLTVSFGTAALLSLLLFILAYLRKQSISHLKGRSFLLIMIGAGVTTALGNQVALYLNSRIPSILQFPTINGSVVILSTIVSSLIFGEKLTGKGKLGLGLGIVALVLLCL